MLDHQQWKSLESRQIKAQLTTMYKIVNINLVDVPAEQYRYLTPASSRTSATHSQKFWQISAKTTYKNSFFPRRDTT